MADEVKADFAQLEEDDERPDVEASGLEPTAVVDSIADMPGLFGA